MLRETQFRDKTMLFRITTVRKIISLLRIVSRPIIRRPITIRAITVRNRITNHLTISLRLQRKACGDKSADYDYTKAQTEPPEDIIEDTTSLQSVLNYVNSLGRTTDEYYNIGAGLGHDGSDYGKAEAVYNWIRGNVSGNCQVFSAATMYACKGVGLECRYAFFSPDAWYGHMANLVCVEGTWYVFDTQGGRFLKSDKYGEITRIFDENDNTIEISISESAY